MNEKTNLKTLVVMAVLLVGLATTIAVGDVWSFETASYFVVDDFESYVDHPALRAVWTTGHLTGNGAELFVETDLAFVRDGNSMMFAYRNYRRDFVGAETEANTVDLEVGTDWTASGVEALVLYFYGDAGNGQEGQFWSSYHINNDQMYVALEDGSTKVGIVKYPDMNDIQEASWQEWNIDLADPCLADVNMANVVKVYIGFGGQKTGQSARGAGTKSGAYDTVWFDDIRLSPPGPANIAPVACIVGGDRTVEVGSGCQARVVLDGSCSSDADSTPGTNDDINDFDWYVVDACDPNYEDYLGSGEIIECNLPLGEHDIILEVTDKAGAFDANEVIITVEDTTPPEFSLSVTPNVLWPANHKMVKITPTLTVSDNCDESPEVMLVSITVNEDDDAKGDGHTANDIQVNDNEIWLRAERSRKGTGRVYAITYQAVDDSGNVTVRSATVTVPHDKR